MVVNIQYVVFCIVTACNFVVCTDALKEIAVSVIIILKMGAILFCAVLITTCKATQCYNPKFYSLGFSLLMLRMNHFFFSEFCW